MPRRFVSHAMRHKVKASVSLLLIIAMLVMVVADPLSLIANTRQAVFGIDSSGIASPPAIDVGITTPDTPAQPPVGSTTPPAISPDLPVTSPGAAVPVPPAPPVPPSMPPDVPAPPETSPGAIEPMPPVTSPGAIAPDFRPALDGDISVEFARCCFPEQVYVYNQMPIRAIMKIQAITRYDSETLELWWYHNGVRRTDLGVQYLQTVSLYSIPAFCPHSEYYQLCECYYLFTSVSLELVTNFLYDQGEWALRAYLGYYYYASPYTMQLDVRHYVRVEPFGNLLARGGIMPFSGTVHLVGSPGSLETARLDNSNQGDITIILVNSFTMTSSVTFAGGRHVTIMSDGGAQRIVTAPPNARHFAVGQGGSLLTLGDLSNSNYTDGTNNFVLQGGSGAVGSRGGSIQTLHGNASGNAYLEMWGGTIRGNTVSGTGLTNIGGAIGLGNDSTFTMHGGVIYNNHVQAVHGGGVGLADRAVFIMYGGEISGNTAFLDGGGIFVGAGSTFTMHNGEISDNTASRRGGGIGMLQSNVATRTVTINNGLIYYNRAVGMGGGIFLGGQSQLTMHNGSITHNSTTAPTSTSSGGAGISIYPLENSGATVTIHNALIAYNEVASTNSVVGGGGVLIRGATSVFTMHPGVTIRNNVARRGGGVTVWQNTRGEDLEDYPLTFNMLGGTITDNEAYQLGGGIYLGVHVVFDMQSGAITNNRAISLVGLGGRGGGIATSSSDSAGTSVTIHNGLIASNRAYGIRSIEAGAGGGVFIQGATSVFTMHDGVEIVYNKGYVGGGVAIISSGDIGNNPGPTFHMYGGSINHNVAISDCAFTVGDRRGQSVDDRNSYDMWPGRHDSTHFSYIPVPTTHRDSGVAGGGGVRLSNNARFIMHDGSINHNMAGAHGGGLSIQGGLASGSIVTMYGGTISYNRISTRTFVSASVWQRTQPRGGGVAVRGGSTRFYMFGGTIANNEARYGGGVVMENDAGLRFYMYGGVVEDNLAHTNWGGLGGGGFNVRHGSTLLLFGPGTYLSNSTGSWVPAPPTDGAIIRNNHTHGFGGGISMQDNTRNTDSYLANPIGNGSTVIMYGGSIYGNTAGGTLGGGGVFMSGVRSNFVMLAGDISNNRARQGGGVMIDQGVFTMGGGYIQGNDTYHNRVILPGEPGYGDYLVRGPIQTYHATNTLVSGGSPGIQYYYANGRGAGVRVAGNRSYFIMADAGSRSVNIIHADPIPTFVMSGTGTIKNNHAGMSGGGIAVENADGAAGRNPGPARAYMYGGYIRDNEAHGVATFHPNQTSFQPGRYIHVYIGGGGVYVRGNSTFTMRGGYVEYNTASIGGGALVTAGRMHMYGGTIRDNIAEYHGGGILVARYATTTQSGIAQIRLPGGYITGNTALQGDGGGIFASRTLGGGRFPTGGYLNIARTATFATLTDNEAFGAVGVAPLQPLVGGPYNFVPLLTNHQINYNNHWTVIFNLMGGTADAQPAGYGGTGGIRTSIVDAPVDPYTVSAARVPANVVRPGYTFLGWYRIYHERTEYFEYVQDGYYYEEDWVYFETPYYDEDAGVWIYGQYILVQRPNNVRVYEYRDVHIPYTSQGAADRPVDANLTFYALFGPALTDITVTKTVSGEMANPRYDFSFVIYFYDDNQDPIEEGTRINFVRPNGTPDYFYTTDGANGHRHEFTLRHGQSVTFTGIHIDYNVRVVEILSTIQEENYDVTIYFYGYVYYAPDSVYRFQRIAQEPGNCTDIQQVGGARMQFAFNNHRSAPPVVGVFFALNSLLLLVGIGIFSFGATVAYKSTRKKYN